MTVEVETPTGVRSGSSVIETTITKGPRTGQGSGLTATMKGEAVAVDLGSGQTLFALLNGDRQADRKSVVSGKCLSVRVDLVGRRILTKKNQPYKDHRCRTEISRTIIITST